MFLAVCLSWHVDENRAVFRVSCQKLVRYELLNALLNELGLRLEHAECGEHFSEQVFVLHALVRLHSLHDCGVYCVRPILHYLGLLRLRALFFNGRDRQVEPELVALEVRIQVEAILQDAVSSLILRLFRNL